MKKEEFLAMSLPYGLKMINITYECTEILEMNGLFFPNAIHFKETNRDDYFHFYSKPILRPLSDLTKSIEHNGEKFVPIVELAKISWIMEYVNFKFQSLKEESVFIAFSDKKNVFGYDSNTQSFFGGLDGESCSVVNQLQLFQKLIEWHFDIAGLIENGEAIDVNTLPENPYK